MSLEKMLARLQEQINPTPPDFDPEEARRQAEQDVAEIQALGLVDRARGEFTARLPGGILHEWRIGYFMTKETVWCDARYTLPGGTEVLQKEFGFRKGLDARWELIWDEPGLLEDV